jgi:hypothetical protein
MKCSFVTFSWGYVGSSYTCDVSFTDYSNPSMIDSVIGAHAVGKTNKDVTGMRALFLNITVIPKNIASFFPNLKALSFTGSQIGVLTNSDLENLPELQLFMVRQNRIVSVDGDFFKNNLKLQYIDFFTNQIKTVGENLIGNIKSLIKVDFGYNPCVNRTAETAQQFSDLNLLLPVLCPQGNSCSYRCTLNQEVTSLANEIAKIKQDIAILQRK